MTLRIKGLPPEDTRAINKRFDELENKLSKTTVDVTTRILSGSIITGDKHYIHNQVIPSAIWTIIHNLGKFPAVTIVDSAGTVWICDVKYIDENTVTIEFSSEFSGKAYLN